MLKCVIPFVLLLAACAKEDVPPVVKVETRVVEVARPAPVIPRPSPVKLRPVEWVILTEENASSKITSAGGVVFGMSAKSYENLTWNLDSVKVYMRQSNAAIAAFDNYYDGQTE